MVYRGQFASQLRRRRIRVTSGLLRSGDVLPTQAVLALSSKRRKTDGSCSEDRKDPGIIDEGRQGDPHAEG